MDSSDSLTMDSGQTAPNRSKSAAAKVPGPAKLLNVDASHVAIERLLAMSQQYRSDGKIREAMELYWELAEDHPQTDEAAVAKAMLLELATRYERNGAPHMARSIYERFLDGED